MYFNYGKRGMDILISFFAIIILMPVFILTGLYIKVTSKGSVIFKQNRVGKHGKQFLIYKFRTMVTNADEIGPSNASDGDQRITKAGRILRKLSLDELPQLFNVLVGDMSIIGYRPGIKKDYDPEYLKSKVFSVKPGITGYAQVNGRSSLTVSQKKNWELKYVDDISFTTDLMIFLKTIVQVLKRKDTN
jgi:lipopolysaccharide/colanic/teichoic acid biosynthesis glycosyltransferase